MEFSRGTGNDLIGFIKFASFNEHFPPLGAVGWKLLRTKPSFEFYIPNLECFRCKLDFS